jgi:hypothetical protein
MGVFTRGVAAVLLLAMPWRWHSDADTTEGQSPGASREPDTPTPTRLTEFDKYPSSSVLRADLEAIRRRP